MPKAGRRTASAGWLLTKRNVLAAGPPPGSAAHPDLRAVQPVQHGVQPAEVVLAPARLHHRPGKDADAREVHPGLAHECDVLDIEDARSEKILFGTGSPARRWSSTPRARVCSGEFLFPAKVTNAAVGKATPEPVAVSALPPLTTTKDAGTA